VRLHLNRKSIVTHIHQPATMGSIKRRLTVQSRPDKKRDPISEITRIGLETPRICSASLALGLLLSPYCQCPRIGLSLPLLKKIAFDPWLLNGQDLALCFSHSYLLCSGSLSCDALDGLVE
jgi:hypothetical protein